jgi:phosphatidylglycerol---prolipoprotein diacylglyceryl transferase
VIHLLAIEISWNPNITEVGGFLITWHGIFTAAGILGGVWLALLIARRVGFDEDIAYTLALIGVPSGIIGARVLYVLEHWSFFRDHPGEIVRITEGGITIWGGILGGFAGALLFGLLRRYPMRLAIDIGAIGMIFGMAVGRIGNLINGEHLATATDLPWGVIYTHPESPAFTHSLLVGAHHPATTYELLGNLVILGLLFAVFFGPFRTRPGMTFITFFATYAVMRFFLSELRLDSPDSFIPGLTAPQAVSLLAVVIAIPAAVWFWRHPQRDEPSEAAPPGRVPVERS